MKRNYYIITLIYVIFFAISFLTNVLGALNPNVTDSYRLSGTMTEMLCTAIPGGAVFALLIGNIKDLAGLKTGMSMIFLLFAYIIGITFWADPLVKNATFQK